MTPEQINKLHLSGCVKSSQFSQVSGRSFYSGLFLMVPRMPGSEPAVHTCHFIYCFD
jgi:hypothetical protein